MDAVRASALDLTQAEPVCDPGAFTCALDAAASRPLRLFAIVVLSRDETCARFILMILILCDVGLGDVARLFDWHNVASVRTIGWCRWYCNWLFLRDFLGSCTVRGVLSATALSRERWCWWFLRRSYVAAQCTQSGLGTLHCRSRTPARKKQT